MRNGVVHGETGWSTFWEREAKDRVGFLVRVLEGRDFVGKVGRACVEEIGVAAKWWRDMVSLGRKLKVEALSKGVWRKKMSLDGLAEIGVTEIQLEKMRQKELVARIRAEGKITWEKSLEKTPGRRTEEADQRRDERIGRYLEEKGIPKLETYANGSDGAKVRMMCRGDSLPVRMNNIVAWKYGEQKGCECGTEESERHVLLECRLYEGMRRDWLEKWRQVYGDDDPMEGILGYREMNEELEGEVMKAIGRIWRERERRELEREV